MKKLFIGTMLLFGVVTGVIAQRYPVPELITTMEDLQDIVLNSEYSSYTVSKVPPNNWKDPEGFFKLETPLVSGFYCYKQIMPDNKSIGLIFVTEYDKLGGQKSVNIIFYMNDEEGYYSHDFGPFSIENSDKEKFYRKILTNLESYYPDPAWAIHFPKNW